MRHLALLFAAAWALAAVNHVGPASAYPDPAVTGLANPAVRQSTIGQTVCKAGYTATIRPPASYTNKLKRQQMADLNLSGVPADYEEDHFISLEIGGDPRDARNLWPEPYAGRSGARIKDQVENQLHRALCLGTMTLAQVQACITDDWIACGRRIGRQK